MARFRFDMGNVSLIFGTIICIRTAKVYVMLGYGGEGWGVVLVRFPIDVLQHGPDGPGVFDFGNVLDLAHGFEFVRQVGRSDESLEGFHYGQRCGFGRLRAERRRRRRRGPVRCR